MPSVTVHDQDELSQTTQRVWNFPDGLSRVVSMSKWHWKTYDHLMTRYPSTDLATSGYELAVKHAGLGAQDFQAWVIKGIRDVVRAMWDLEQNEQKANDNGILDDTPTAVPRHRSATTDFNKAVVGLQSEPLSMD